MGYNVFLLGIKGKTPEDIWREYNVFPTYQFAEEPEAEINGAMLHSGMYVIFHNRCDIPTDEMISRLSIGAEVYFCEAYECVMESGLCCWINGQKSWSVLYKLRKNVKQLETFGAVPVLFEEIRDRLCAKNQFADVDYVFDVPIELFASLGGMRYPDDITRVGPGPWQMLARPKQPTLWQRFLGIWQNRSGSA